MIISRRTAMIGAAGLAAAAATTAAPEMANIIFGTNIDQNIKDKVHISMIATGIDPFKSQLEEIDFDTEFPSVPDKVIRNTCDIQFEPDTLFGQQRHAEDLDVPTVFRKKKLFRGTPLYSNEE